MKIDATQPIGEITRCFPAAASVFERMGIDYCCQGKRSLAEVCTKRGLLLSEVVAQLEGIDRKGDINRAPVGDIAKLIDYIEQEHHAFTRSELTRLKPLAEKVKRVHGASHPEVVTVHHLLTELATELEPHMRKEEAVLFPYVRHLAGGKPESLPLPKITGPIAAMHAENERVSVLLAELSATTNGYRPPMGACASYCALYGGLLALQSDLREHVHLENNVLFPAAARLEAEQEGLSSALG